MRILLTIGLAPPHILSLKNIQIAFDDPRNTPLTSIRVSHEIQPEVERVLSSCFRREADERPLARDLLRLRCFRDINPSRVPKGLRSLKDAMSSAAGRGSDQDGYHRRGASTDTSATVCGTRAPEAAPLAAVRSATPRAARRGPGSPVCPASRVPYLVAPAGTGGKGNAGESAQFALGCILRGDDASASHQIMGASVRGVKLGDPERSMQVGAEVNPFSLNGSYGAKARELRIKGTASQHVPWVPPPSSAQAKVQPAARAQQRSQQHKKRANPFALGGAKSSTPPRIASEGVLLSSLERRHGEHGVLNPIAEKSDAGASLPSEWDESGEARLASHDSLGLFPLRRPAPHP